MVAPRRTLDILGTFDTEKAASELYETIVKSMDWARILIEAASRHQDLRGQVDPAHRPWTFLEGDEICPECVTATLLDYREI